MRTYINTFDTYTTTFYVYEDDETTRYPMYRRYCMIQWKDDISWGVYFPYTDHLNKDLFKERLEQLKALCDSPNKTITIENGVCILEDCFQPGIPFVEYKLSLADSYTKREWIRLMVYVLKTSILHRLESIDSY